MVCAPVILLKRNNISNNLHPVQFKRENRKILTIGFSVPDGRMKTFCTAQISGYTTNLRCIGRILYVQTYKCLFLWFKNLVFIMFSHGKYVSTTNSNVNEVQLTSVIAGYETVDSQLRDNVLHIIKHKKHAASAENFVLVPMLQTIYYEYTVRKNMQIMLTLRILMLKFSR